MEFDYQRLLNWPIPEVRQRYTVRDTMLYALGVGLGADPLDAGQLGFVYEDGLQVLPTYPVVLGYPGFWMKEPGTGIDWVRLVHGEQGIVIHKLPPPEGEVIGRTRITSIIDKGAGKGMLVYTERRLTDAATGELLASLPSTTFCRGNGGFGGPTGPVPPVHALPDRAPDRSIELPTLPQQALLYRLSGDYNPLHAEPKVAQAAKFERPILHGLCTLGVAGHALLKAAGYVPERLAAIHARFTAPVYPGDVLTTDIWQDGAVWSFRTRVAARDNTVVLGNGRAVLHAA
ncbi:MaoC/PaaZ C-terminal domain-containing protein [Algiphilus sp. W345]|uniref:MaoC/PaaZ C-terminal domain-containing protein n=1 Tax=Banduia mediterranea TaxID=3075609 RepID=A0ABU2WEW7_9GAMM|nr:MaoC/PaaZ C-terminal domain-containing protein [Algiphilus sp. W345]MDT0496169.1 MaoC/PaaZ C-terminal domain-containing protein [Algiphilus sp. W345]